MKSNLKKASTFIFLLFFIVAILYEVFLKKKYFQSINGTENLLKKNYLNPNSIRLNYQNLSNTNILEEEKLRIIELLKINQIGDVCIISISNFGYKKFTLNWIQSLLQNNYQKFLIFSFDIQLVDYLNKNGFANKTVLVPKNWIDFQITIESSNWASKEYNQIQQAKIQICYQLLKINQNILFSDPDVVFLNKNILTHIDFIYFNSPADLILTQDNMLRTFNYNMGLFYARATIFVQTLFLRLILEQRKDPIGSIDQLVLRKMLSEEKYNDSRIIGLDPILFPSGQVFFHEKLNDKLNIKPYTVHANYIVGKEKKIDILKSKGLWFVE